MNENDKPTSSINEGTYTSWTADTILEFTYSDQEARDDGEGQRRRHAECCRVREQPKQHGGAANQACQEENPPRGIALLGAEDS